MVKVQVLLSCMNKIDFSIVERSNIQTDAIIVNQCDKNCVEEISLTNQDEAIIKVKMICTTERGLSKSRNMAIKNGTGDICVLCDEDEVLENGYEKTILQAYQTHNADVILFDVLGSDSQSRLSVPQGKISFKKIMSSHSVQITFKREAIVNSGVSFDEKMGAGTGNGGGEEIKFLYELYKKGYDMYSENSLIAKLSPSDSSWFSGYDEQFFLNYGWSTRRWAGPLLGYAYIWYYVLMHREDYSGQCSMINVIKYIHKGFFSKR